LSYLYEPIKLRVANKGAWKKRIAAEVANGHGVECVNDVVSTAAACAARDLRSQIVVHKALVGAVLQWWSDSTPAIPGRRARGNDAVTPIFPVPYIYILFSFFLLRRRKSGVMASLRLYAPTHSAVDVPSDWLDPRGADAAAPSAIPQPAVLSANWKSAIPGLQSVVSSPLKGERTN
jgi:hypothetical protein